MKKLLILSVCAGLLNACATTVTELKAPCSPLECKNRIQVNTWPVE